jgi:hypothetical protein
MKTAGSTSAIVGPWLWKCRNHARTNVMLKHETQLIDPNADEIAATLSACVTDTNKRCRVRRLEDNPRKWHTLARHIAAKTEGWEMFRAGRGGVPATQIIVAWWSDVIGRKHVVVRGWRIEHHQARMVLYRDILETLPPLLHAYPEYVCLRQLGSQTPEVICACGCGAIGTPATLGWMGRTCGPCYDRQQEAGAEAFRGHTPGILLSYRQPLGDVACSPDGERVAAVEGHDLVTYWDLPQRTRTTLQVRGSRVEDVAITHDGRYLVVVGVSTTFDTVDYPTGGLVAVFDLSADPPVRVDQNTMPIPAMWRIVALPDSHSAIALQQVPFHAATVVFLEIPSGQVVKQFDLGQSYISTLTISATGRRLLAGRAESLCVIDLETHTTLREWSGYHIAAALSPDGQRVYIYRGNMFQIYDLTSGKRYQVRGHENTPRGVQSLIAAPTGRWLFGSSYTGQLHAFCADTFKPVAEFKWHRGPITGLAISADGRRLFSSASTDSGVKVWPIRDLLPRPPTGDG